MAKNPHTELVNKILLRIGATEYCRVWKNQTGAAVGISIIKMFQKSHGYRVPANELMKYIIQFGLVGSADILGILCNGKMLAIEVKTGAGRQTSEQKNFQKMILSFKGVYILAREDTPILKLVIRASEL